MQQVALKFSRWFVGVLFIFSGLIKINDPLGFSYKLQEYFDVFHLSFLNNWATGIAIFLCALEIVLGALLLLGFWLDKVAKGLLGLILFFTLLTFASAAFTVVTSCGCFGDAIPLTPWHSFGKDLVLLALIVYLFKHRHSLKPVTINVAWQKRLLVFLAVVSLFFGLFTYNYLPVIDFLPYKVGVSIPNSMKIPAGAAADEYLILYQLKNKATGESKTMTDKEYLKLEVWKDNNWEVVGTPERKLLKKGVDIKIKDLIINDASGTDYTKEIIENPYFNLVVVAYNLDDTNEKALGEINTLALKLNQQYNMRTVLLTATAQKEASLFSKTRKLALEIFYADAVPLKSMVRANPGILLLKDGVIINKWHYHSLPTFDVLTKKYLKP